MTFILDASVALSWFFEDEDDAYAESVKRSLTSNAAVVPFLWNVEIANGLIVAERRGRIAPEKVNGAADVLARLPITAVIAVPTVSALVASARRYALSTYDALYVQLALERALPLATLDEKLEAACREAGIGRYTPTT